MYFNTGNNRCAAGFWSSQKERGTAFCLGEVLIESNSPVSFDVVFRLFDPLLSGRFGVAEEFVSRVVYRTYVCAKPAQLCAFYFVDAPPEGSFVGGLTLACYLSHCSREDCGVVGVVSL